MAAIQNDRDVFLQAASPRVIPPTIPIDQIDGLGPALKRLRINAPATTFIGTSGTTSPATITLTAERLNGLTGPVVWSVLSGSGTVAPSGDTAVVTGSTVTGQSITLRARVTEDAINYDAQITLTKLGTLSGQANVNLATQITGQLANSNVSGLGALALLGAVDLATTQVVGNLAAGRIGVGTLAAGVIYAGTVNVDNLVGTTISGKNISGADLIYVGGNSDAAPIYLKNISGVGYAAITGYFSALGGGNTLQVNPTLGVQTSGNMTRLGTTNVEIPATTITIGSGSGTSTFGGTLGSRIILKGVTYTNVEVNGVAGTTVKFN